MSGRRRGQAMLEMALVVTVLLFLTMGIIQYGILYNASVSLTNITREGARYAAVKGLQVGETDDTIKAYMRTVASSTPIRPERMNISITPAQGSRRPGEKVTVSVQYDLRTKMFLPASFPGLGRYGATYTTTGTMLCE
jgi:Flp pilus assembly protein TadG